MKHSNLIFAVLAVVICIGLLSYDFIPAFADISITIITPTGGALGATSDCTLVVRSADVIWHNCNNVLYSIDADTNAVLHSLAVTVDTSDRFLGSPNSNAVYVMDNTANTVTRYIDDGANVVANGVYSPSGCSFGANLQYDPSGYMWVVCDSEDLIARFNPATMSEVSRSQDLTDGAGIECDLPTHVTYSVSDNIGVIKCSTTANIVTFSIASSTTVTLLDSEVALAGTNNVVTDGANNYILEFGSLSTRRYTFDGAGLMTLAQTISIGNDNCRQEYSQAPEKFIVCNDDSGTNTIVNSFVSNSTGLFHIGAGVASGFDNSNAIGIDVTSGSFSTWYFASSLNDQRIVVITGLRQQDAFTPTPPGGGTGGDTDGIDCEDPANEFLLTCRLGGDGSLVGAGNFIVGNVNGTTGLTPIICATGIVDCVANPDMKTNGVGYLLVTIGLGIIIGVLWVASRGDLNSIPTFIWFVATLAVVGAFTLMDLIDATFLVITAIIVVALAAAKVRGLFGGEFR